ncbi:MAG: hypothetical protein ACREVX_06785 [Clostridium sp.]|uniref:hypothetical protein n=1 Tax=Clostridium sp. TaxID=1506 RepID=UPI003D6D90BB
MKLEDGNIEDIDMEDEYDMVPLEPMMYGCGQMNMMPNMEMGRQDSNFGMRNSCWGMNQSAPVDPWARVSQFDNEMFESGFNPMGTIYDEKTESDYEYESEDSMQLDKYQNRVPVQGQYNDVESIVFRIEKYNPIIFKRLTRCGIPYTEVKQIVRRIVKLSLMHRDE